MIQTQPSFILPVKLIFGMVFFFSNVFGQEQDTIPSKRYDPSFHAYLNEVRIACLNKDTSQLHQLLGDAAFGMSCFGLDGVDRNYSNDWETFAAHFKLLDQPGQSGFWDLFIRLSNQGFYYDSPFDTYEVPSSHCWGMLETYSQDGEPLYDMPMFQKMFYTDTVTIFVGNDLATSKPTAFVPEKRGTRKYPYEFNVAENGYYLCLENGKALGFVSAKDIIQWNLHFSFIKKDERWILDLYETCTTFDW